jgi:CDP-diacylglycerol--glycerol-3-phosphate 3-phosphatidyltransferase
MSTTSSDFSQIADTLPNLKKRWATFTLLGYVSLSSITFLLNNLWNPYHSIRWLVISAIGLLYLTGILWRNLDKNHRPSEIQLLPTLGLGNNLTLLRGWLLAALGGFLLSPAPDGYLAWLPALIYSLAIAIDFLDGYAARVSNHVTRLGEILDINLDGVGVMIATLLAIQYGTLPLWYLAVALARYLFLAGIRIREERGLVVRELGPSLRRRAYAGLQMGFLSTMLWPIFTPPGTPVAAFIFALPFLVGFGMDWFIVSGAIKPGNHFQNIKINRSMIAWVPLALRLTVLVVISVIIFTTYGNFLPQHDTAPLSTIQTNETTGVFILGLEIIVTCMLVFGISGRVAAIAGLLLLGVQQIHTGLHLAQFFLIFLYIAILYLGTGKYSLWQPEDHLIFKQAGRPREHAAMHHGNTIVRRKI